MKHISHKICILSLAAAMLLGLGAQAADTADPEQGAAASQAVETVQPPAVAENGQGASGSDPEKPTAAAATGATTSSPPVHKLSVTTNAIKLDGSAVKPAGYNINDENYFKLRDIAYLMNGKQAQFNVGWDGATSSITLTTGAAYQKAGGEMAGAAAKPTIRESNAKVLVDGKPVSMTAYNIDGNNYFRLRDIGTQLGFDVGYDNTSRTILIDNPQPAPNRYTVSFDMNGHGTQISPKANVDEGSKISAPAAPEATGYAFDGWYKDSGCNTAWNFSKDTVTEDVTLYAKWTQTFTVTFEMNGHGTQVSPKTGVKTGSKITEPAKPTADGYVFGGWYAESDCYIAWSFATDVVARDVTLYAKWTPKGDADDMGNTDDSGSSANQGGVVNTRRLDGVMTILLDSGHGGKDPGESGNGLEEKRVNLAVTQYLKEMLENAGVKVVMTVESLDTDLKGSDRIAFVREKMDQYNFDLSVSIHHNGGGGVGAEVFVQTDKQDPSGASRDLGNLIIEEYKKLGQTSRGVKTQNLYMVRVPSEFGVPGILSEFCFLDNASDAVKIDSDEEQRAEAQALYNAIMAYFENHEY
ncbi:InlB B-repeat-containing protein [Intestinibacillus massiliensis]|uniref:InlB B-repeat-containing protein n=1 Tax=Intestinibacillus massiliensis TaxID=1871029 RepID=UPI000B361FAB|nr:InlB B-repeat-containing protein [Intestinibacillus massiliensis]